MVEKAVDGPGQPEPPRRLEPEIAVEAQPEQHRHPALGLHGGEVVHVHQAAAAVLGCQIGLAECGGAPDAGDGHQEFAGHALGQERHAYSRGRNRSPPGRSAAPEVDREVGQRRLDPRASYWRPAAAGRRRASLAQAQRTSRLATKPASTAVPICWPIEDHIARLIGSVSCSPDPVGQDRPCRESRQADQRLAEHVDPLPIASLTWSSTWLNSRRPAARPWR